MRQVTVITFLVVLLSCASCKQKESGGKWVATSTSAAPATYTPRIGVAVNTGGRTCMAIHNANIAASTPVTLVSPMPPQAFVEGQVTGPSSSACPITKEVDRTVSNYDVHLTQAAAQKLTPLIAVLGASAPFSMASNGAVQADLDQNHKTETFRACSASDGIHLTVWSGDPLSSALLWHGYYYEPSNPGLGPSCTVREMAGP